MKITKKSTLVTAIILIFNFLISKSGYIDYKMIDSNHFNIITVNSVFAGFLFSSLALIIGLYTYRPLIRLERANYMDNIYKNIIYGIISSIFSICIALFNIFIYTLLKSKIKVGILTFIFDKYIPVLELTFLVITIIAFLLAVRDVKFIIISVKKTVIKNFPEEEIKKTLELIKK